ncbi:ferritin-like domain-containing protein [Altericroceibacterium xinjiangense]|uniref:ferritin-like domain-containing protein n=1 Tax=Altericroceibacterium xinjiangense TaxID=762261 RepID=UPI000F7D9773|nr:ferritin-like domain-containing protein [Altericroceibacterium xinjiangense]
MAAEAPSVAPSIAGAIRSVLLTAEPRDKVMATRALVRGYRTDALSFVFDVAMPERPAWPAELELLPPNRMPKRGRGGSERGRIALWHSLAHIEFVAIDLALDMAGRFGGEMGPDFVADFLSVAADEAMHFALIARKLKALGSHYGALPAHDGLWEAAHATRGDVAARLAIVPMVLEARGLDVTPPTLERVRAAGDEGGARILDRILKDEIRHVRTGTEHFVAHCERLGQAPEDTWKTLVATYFRGTLKPPFNDSARLAAGLSRNFYAAVATT